MEPGVKDREFMYQLIIGQLYHDGHNQIALELSNSIGLNQFPPPSDKLSQLVSAARLVEDDTHEEEKDADIQMLPNQVADSIDNLSIDEESGDYFPFLALPPELKDRVFTYLSIKDRMRARVTKSLVEIEAKNKYHVKKLYILEKCCTRGPFPHQSLIDEDKKEIPEDTRTIVLLETKSYSSDFIRRIAHNASIGSLIIMLSRSSDFYREVYNLIKKIDIGFLTLWFKNKDLEKEMMVESFILDLTRTCKILSIEIDNVTPEIIHELYKIILDGSAKIRQFYSDIEFEKCISFLQLIGITHRDGTLFSNRNIEVYEADESEEFERWHVFDGQLEMVLRTSIFKDTKGDFDLFHHETPEALEKAKNEEWKYRIEIGPE